MYFFNDSNATKVDTISKQAIKYYTKDNRYVFKDHSNQFSLYF